MLKNPQNEDYQFLTLVGSTESSPLVNLFDTIRLWYTLPIKKYS